jgi:cell division septum initiation protein DivIVA
MASLRPEDLDIATLPRSPLGNLKPQPVADLLKRAAWDFREALGQNQKLSSRVEELTARVDELTAKIASLEEAASRRKDSDELAGTLLASAQRTAREAREGARQECELMLKKAAQRAQRLEADSIRRAEHRLSELAKVEALREEVAARLRATLEAIVDRRGEEANNGNAPERAAAAPARAEQ